jgi:O-succinylbenzoic acid--CoA ligase
VDYVPLALGGENAVDSALAGAARGIYVETSGTTGAPRAVLLSREALLASAHATHAALSGPGAWLLALPTDRIAGAMVLARSRLAGTPATRLPPGSFSAGGFATATASLPEGVPRYVSLVPTQLHRLVADPQGREALASYDAVLVGGAAMPTNSRIGTLVSTYGATETAGGCVYDGVPLADTRVEIRDGIVWVSGPCLAQGYADGENSRFVTEAGRRWFVTSDLGEFDDAGRLRILGRADDVIVTGGVKVPPGPVEGALCGQPWVHEAVVVGVPDAEWGEAVVALVTVATGRQLPSSEDVRAALALEVPRTHIPRVVHPVDVLPRLSSGKIDRAAAREWAANASAERGDAWPR